MSSFREKTLNNIFLLNPIPAHEMEATKSKDADTRERLLQAFQSSNALRGLQDDSSGFRPSPSKFITAMKAAHDRNVVVVPNQVQQPEQVEVQAPCNTSLMKSCGIQTVRRGPYELDNTELQAIRDGRAEVLEMLRLQGVLVDTDTSGQLDEKLLDERFRESRQIPNVNDRISHLFNEELTADDDGISPDSLGRCTRKAGPYYQLQQAKFMLRRQEEKINEIMRKVHVRGNRNQGTRAVEGGGDDTADLKQKLKQAQARIRNSETEFTALEKSYKEARGMADQLGAEVQSTKNRIEKLKSITCSMINDLSKALTPLSSKPRIEPKDVLKVVLCIRNSFQDCAFNCVSDFVQLVGNGNLLEDTKRSIKKVISTADSLKGIIEGKVIPTRFLDEKSAIRKFEEAATKITGMLQYTIGIIPSIPERPEATDGEGETSGDENTAKTPLPDEQVEEIDNKAVLVNICKQVKSSAVKSVAHLVEVRKSLESVGRYLDMDPPIHVETNEFIRIQTIIQTLRSNFTKLIEDKLAERIIVAQESWAAEVQKINNERKSEEQSALSNCLQYKALLESEMQPIRRTKARLLFSKVACNRKLEKLKNLKIPLPRWIVYSLKRVYSKQLLNIQLQLLSLSFSMNDLMKAHWKNFETQIISVFTPWKKSPQPTRRKGQPASPAVVYNNESDAHKLWGILHDLISKRSQHLESGINGFTAASDVVQYALELMNAHVRYLRRDEQDRIRTWENIKQRRDILRDQENKLRAKSEGRQFWSSSSLSPSSDKPVYVSGKVGEQIARNKNIKFTPVPPPCNIIQKRPQVESNVSLELEGRLPPLCLVNCELPTIKSILSNGIYSRVGAGLITFPAI